jgi:hypothetical protein
VRDRIRYNPFQNFTLDDTYRASVCIEQGSGMVRAQGGAAGGVRARRGIPARVGYADVRNHITTPELTAKMGTDLFVFHGYTELLLDGKLGEGDAGVQPLAVHPVPRQAARIRRDERFPVPPVRRGQPQAHGIRADRGSLRRCPGGGDPARLRETYPKYFNLGPDAAKLSFAPA